MNPSVHVHVCTAHIHCTCTCTCTHGYLSSKTTEPGKEELGESEGKVFVEEVAQESDHPVVGPASMD